MHYEDIDPGGKRLYPFDSVPQLLCAYMVNVPIFRRTLVKSNKNSYYYCVRVTPLYTPFVWNKLNDDDDDDV